MSRAGAGRAPPAPRRAPSAMKFCRASQAQSSLVNASPVICATLIPGAGHGTIGARRHVPTDPVPRYTIRRSRWPSSSPISRARTRPAIPSSMHWATRQHVRRDQRVAGGQMPAAMPPVVMPWRARAARGFRRVQDGAGGTAVRSPGLGRPGWGLFALVVGPLVLLEPYFGLDRGFPFAAVEGLPGAALGAGNDHLAHKCSLLWLITNAKPEQRSNPDTPGSCRASPNSPRGRRARGPRDEQGRIAATSSAPTPWEFRVQLGPPGRGMAGPGLSAWASSWPCGCVLSGKPWGSAARLTGPP